jgi:Fe2+ or Zn2+ uptake regulation protein
VTDSKGVDAGLLQTRYRLTKQRAAILRALEDGAHLTAETIHERVRAELPAVSLGTIYRTLDILRAIGLVQVFAHGSAARYEASLDKHHHLLCSTCRTLENVQADGLGEIATQIAAAKGFSDVDYGLTIVGRCGACGGKPGKNGVN